MTESEQRVAIAEACGLNTVKEQVGGIFCFRDKAGRMVGALPDYLRDLNDCAEMRKSLLPAELMRYVAELEDAIDPYHVSRFDLVNASAAHHCKAFLMTKRLWRLWK